MNSARLLREMGEVDSAFVDTAPIEHHIKKRKATLWLKGCAIAACFALIFTCVYSLYNASVHNDADIVYASENTPFVIPPNTGTKPINSFSQFWDGKVYDFQELANCSELIVVADVVAVEEGSRLGNAFCNNHATVKIREVLKGNVTEGTELCVDDPTSSMRTHAISIPMMQRGNRVLLFLVKQSIVIKSSQGEDVPIYGFVREYPEVGKFFYDYDGKYHESRSYAEDDLKSSMVFTDLEPKTLEEIKTLIDEK